MYYYKHDVYQCPGCRGWFKQSLFRCGVIHRYGECCHHGEPAAVIPLDDKDYGV